MGSNPCHDTCVLEQDTLLKLLLFTQGYKWVPARVAIDTVEKHFLQTQASTQELPNVSIVLPQQCDQCKEFY